MRQLQSPVGSTGTSACAPPESPLEARHGARRYLLLTTATACAAPDQPTGSLTSPNHPMALPTPPRIFVTTNRNRSWQSFGLAGRHHPRRRRIRPCHTSLASSRSMRQRTRLADGSFAVVWVKKSPGRIGQGFSLITAEQEARQILSIFPSERARLPPPPERSIEPQHAPPGLPVRHIPDRVDLLQGEIAHRGNPPSLPLRRRRVA